MTATIIGLIVLVILCLILCEAGIQDKPPYPVDRDEDRDEADARVQQVKDSMRGTL